MCRPLTQVVITLLRDFHGYMITHWGIEVPACYFVGERVRVKTSNFLVYWIVAFGWACGSFILSISCCINLNEFGFYGRKEANQTK